MTARAREPKIVVAGIEAWPLQKLLDRMREVGEYNAERGYTSPEKCPTTWRAYCNVLEREWRRRGQPKRLF